MASMSSLSQALSMRRGKGLDPSLMSDGNESDHTDPAIDRHVGVHGAGTEYGEGLGVPTEHEKEPFDQKSTTHEDEHTKVEHEGERPSPPASWHSKEHGDEDTKVTHGSMANVNTEVVGAAHQSTGEGLGALDEEIRNEVMGHASKSEHEQLKGMRPRSLGERAKMEALNGKYGK